MKALELITDEEIQSADLIYLDGSIMDRKGVDELIKLAAEEDVKFTYDVEMCSSGKLGLFIQAKM